MTVTENEKTENRARLSRRELEVLELVAQGMSTREIARVLWVSDETVKSHAARLLRRLGARTRAQAVAIAYRDGLWDATRSDDEDNDV